MVVLRTSLIPGLLNVVARNQSFGNVDLRLFEIGHVFSQKTGHEPTLTLSEINEEERLCFVITGQSSPAGWNTPGRLVDIYDLKGEAANLFSKFALDKPLFISYSTSNCLAEDAVAVEINGSRCGHLGAVRDDLLNLFGIEQQVFVAELNLKAFSKGKDRIYHPLSKFPKVRRDVAFIVSKGVMAQDIERTLEESSSGLVSRVELFDVYEGEKLPDGKKGLAFGLELMSRERTLKEDEIDVEVATIVRRVEEKFDATLRRT
jgi:phenylalanyl-tRNA synthetase beta chain